MYAQTQSGNKDIKTILTAKLKTSMMHFLRKVKSRVSNKAKKATAKSVYQQSANTEQMKAPLTRKLTQDEINEAELALKRLQAEKNRLEDLLNGSSGRHFTSQRSCSYTNSNEDVSNTNNNYEKETIRVPRYQQKVAFILHKMFTNEVRIFSKST